MAEGMFRKAVAKRGDYEVGSAGVAATPGGSMSRETQAVLRKRGAEVDGFSSRPVSRGLIEEATHVFAMTRGHLDALEARFPEHAEKFYLACEFIEVAGRGLSPDVPDPIGMGAAAYEEVAKVLEVAIPTLVGYMDGTMKGG